MYTFVLPLRFKAILFTSAAALLCAIVLSASFQPQVFAQEATPGAGDVFVTVTYNEQINVRNGPSTVLYDVIGNMQPGDTAKALGVSPGRDWIEIEFPPGPDGVGWVHISLVTLSSGNLQIVEPPPTITPLVTSTIDPTLAAAYIFEPTVTRMPTFTPPPPLQIPHFTPMPARPVKNGVPMGAIVIGTGLMGVFGFLLSLFRRR